MQVEKIGKIIRSDHIKNGFRENWNNGVRQYEFLSYSFGDFFYERVLLLFLLKIS
jgi:hypothetical protein